MAFAEVNIYSKRSVRNDVLFLDQKKKKKKKKRKKTSKKDLLE